MELETILNIRKGVTALIGGGGKTALLSALGRELSKKGTVILCTTTRIFPPDHIPCLLSHAKEEIRAALLKDGCVCVGTMTDAGKLTAPDLPVSALAALADYVIVEADGARMRPIKAHAAHEPVIPAETNQTILVIGAEGFGKPIREVVHRPEIFCAALGLSPEDIVTPEREAAFVKLEALHDRVLLNQVECENQMAAARALAGHLGCPAAAGSLQKENVICLY